MVRDDLEEELQLFFVLRLEPVIFLNLGDTSFHLVIDDRQLPQRLACLDVCLIFPLVRRVQRQESFVDGHLREERGRNGGHEVLEATAADH